MEQNLAVLTAAITKTLLDHSRSGLVLSSTVLTVVAHMKLVDRSPAQLARTLWMYRQAPSLYQT